MDEDEKFTDDRNQLLERFRQSLSKPISERFFDEDDLVEIFDYAGDIADDYLRMEALMCGARFFPDSEDLLQRRGIFYAQYSDSARKQFLAHGQKSQSLIFDLIAIRDKAPTNPQEAIKEFEDAVNGQEKFTDEEIIQISETIQELGAYEWFKSHLPSIRKKADYPIGLLYEAGMLAEMNQDYAFSAQMLEELTEMEPFNSYYWMLLSRQYAQLEDADKALSAIDYALAIAPNDPLSLYLKAGYFNSLGKDRQTIESLSLKAIKESKGAVEVVLFLAEAYYNWGETQKAIDLLTRILDDPDMVQEHPLFNFSDPAPSKELELIPALIKYGAPNPEALLDRYFSANPENLEPIWCSWATQLSQQGKITLAHKVIECFERNSGTKSDSIFSIEQNFMDKDFQKTLEEIEAYVREMKDFEYDFNYPSVFAMYLISLVKTGNFDHAKSACDKFTDAFTVENGLSVAQRIEKLGLLTLVVQIRENLKNIHNPSDWANFDPLAIW